MRFKVPADDVRRVAQEYREYLGYWVRYDHDGWVEVR